MFKYNYYNDFLKKILSQSQRPFHIELHPGSNCGGFDCQHCYGKSQLISTKTLSMSSYRQLLPQLRALSDFIEISGIHSDPLTYPDIENLLIYIGELNYHFGIHTKGKELTPAVSQILAKQKHPLSYVTISINASSAKKYKQYHGLDCFNQICQNLKTLHQQKLKHHSTLRINCSYLLFEDNSSEEQIKAFIETFSPISDFIKFSIPQPCNTNPQIPFISQKTIDEVSKILSRINEPNIISLLNLPAIRNYDFQYCHSQRFNITIDNSGNLFPCPQVATKDYAHLCFGNVLDSDFYNPDKRKSFFLKTREELGCSICNRRDEEINYHLKELFPP